MVVFYHGSELILKLPSFLNSIFSYFGFVGVELFFVLSGFLIGGILIQDLNSRLDFSQVKRFWLRRWFRTLPNYYLFFLINVLLIGVLKAPADLQHLVFLQNFAWRMPDTDFFGESWSLSIEEWFYIFLPLSIFYLAKFKRMKLCKSVFFAILCIALFSLLSRVILAEWGLVSWRKTFRKIVLLRFDSLMIGVFGAYIKFYFNDLWIELQKCRFIFLGLLLHGLVAAIYFYSDLDHSIAAKTVLFCLVSFSTLILIPRLEVVRPGSSYFQFAITKISAYSYSLYLCNIPVGRIFTYFIDFKIRSENAFALQIWVFCSYLIVCIGISAIVFKHFESPILKFRDRFAN